MAYVILAWGSSWSFKAAEGSCEPSVQQACNEKLAKHLDSRSATVFQAASDAEAPYLAVHWHYQILRFTPRPWPGNLQNPAPEVRILAPRTRENLGFPRILIGSFFGIR